MKEKIWKNPKEQASLDEAQTPFWFWNDQLENDELLRQLKLKSEIGVKCTTPHARSLGGKGFIGGYLDEEWFDHINTVLRYKKEQSEPVWIYDEMDWPAGTCYKTITQDENNREKFLSFETYQIPAGQPFRTPLKDLTGKRISSKVDINEYSFNVFVVDKESGTPVDIRNYISSDMQFEFLGDKDAIAYIVKINILPFAQWGDRTPNYLDAAVTDKFLASTYDVYFERCGEYFGDTIKTFFNDETRMANAFAWCDDLPKVFLARKGYDLLKYIYLLPLDSAEAGKVRCDYFDTIAYLFQNNYFGRLYQWCHKHNVTLSAHLLAEETICGHARYSGDLLRQYKYIDIPCVDHLGKGIGSLNAKFVSAAAHSYGKALTSVEMFAGCGWDMTFEEYIRMITWIYQQGIQIIINHGFFYSDRDERKNDYPPSQFFQWKHFEKVPLGNDMIRRLHYALTGGYNEIDVLVYYPIETFWYHFLPDSKFILSYLKGPLIQGKKAEKMEHYLQLFLNGLISENLDFDMLHQDALDNFEVQGSKITNKLTGQSFSTLVLPMCEILSVQAATLCEAFLNAGGKIIALDEIPYMTCDKVQQDELDVIMKRITTHKNLKLMSTSDLPSVYSEISNNIPHPIEIVSGCAKTVNNHPCYDNYIIDAYFHDGEDISGVMFTRYIKEGNRHTVFMNYGDTEQVIEVKIKSSSTHPTLWDTLTGAVTEAKIISQNENEYVLEITLPSTHSMILVSGL